MRNEHLKCKTVINMLILLNSDMSHTKELSRLPCQNGVKFKHLAKKDGKDNVHLLVAQETNQYKV